MSLNAATAKAQLKSRMEEVVMFLLPNGQLENQEWTCGSVAGEPGQSLKVELYAEKAGIWFDFATGEGGDIFDLWQQIREVDFKTMLVEIDQFL